MRGEGGVIREFIEVTIGNVREKQVVKYGINSRAILKGCFWAEIEVIRGEPCIVWRRQVRLGHQTQPKWKRRKNTENSNFYSEEKFRRYGGA